MRFFSAIPFALMVGLGPIAPVLAEQLQMPESDRAMSQQPLPVEMPEKGMSMEQVKQKYGQPNDTLPAVGDPPITRWIYDGYTVYFEYSHVIHSVTNR